ncbi:MAG: pyridoxal phosphate-dependent decarboxylase family protein, partial [Kangiellaceae bacterium]
MSQSLEPTSEEIREMLALATDKITSFLDNIDQPASYDPQKSSESAFDNPTKLPEEETALKEILDDLFDNRVSNALPTTHPGFMAYIPGGGIFHAALAELIAKITNRYVGIDVTAPFLSQIESDVLRWFSEWVGFPKTSGGSLTSGGSIANLTAVICARTLILGDDFTKGTVYASGFVHHSMWKAFQAAGIASKQIRNVPVDREYRMDTDALQKMLAEDKKNGFKPLIIVATAGSTNTGSVDPLETISNLAKSFSAWYHIDAAYGGFFAMTPLGKKRLKGLELADSITLDPHKGLFLPYGTGAFIVRDREKLKQVFAHQADYIPDKTSE